MDKEKVKLVLVAIFYVWLCLFLFPMIHDLFHELGHAAYSINNCGNVVGITLGEYSSCPNNGQRWITICVTYKWFIQSLYRTSRTTSYYYTFLHKSQSYCYSKTFSLLGGVFGLIFMWLLTAIIVTPIWRFWVRSDWRISLIVGCSYLFCPLIWLSELAVRPKWLKMLLGIGAIFMQFDMINEIFYAFFPSRLIIFDYMPYGDGSIVWNFMGYTPKQVQDISYGIWAVLLLLYLTVFFFYGRYVMAIKREPEKVQILPVSTHDSSAGNLNESEIQLNQIEKTAN